MPEITAQQTFNKRQTISVMSFTEYKTDVKIVHQSSIKRLIKQIIVTNIMVFKSFYFSYDDHVMSHMMIM